MKRAAITGIGGQDGTYLARGLLRRGYEVHGLLQSPLDRAEPRLRQRYTANEFAAIRWSTGSLEDPFSLVRFPRKRMRCARPKLPMRTLILRVAPEDCGARALK